MDIDVSLHYSVLPTSTPNCMELFASNNLAARHLATAILKGACPKRPTGSLYPLLLPATLFCPLCGFEATELSEFYLHSRQHLPWAIAVPSGHRRKDADRGTSLNGHGRLRAAQAKAAHRRSTGSGRRFGQRGRSGRETYQISNKRRRRQRQGCGSATGGDLGKASAPELARPCRPHRGDVQDMHAGMGRRISYRPR